MRKILFRGKLIHSKVWIYGNLIIASTGESYIIPSDVIKPDGHHLIIDSDCPFLVDAETVGQFTGLTDKNGKEIYEGDIVIYPHDSKPCEVFYRANEYGTSFLTDSHDGVDSLGDVLNTVEIIGNIHDNPELIK